MEQYLGAPIIVIKNKDGEIRKVIDFRKRLKYDKNNIFIGKVLAGEELRVDIMAGRLINQTILVDSLIDVNEIDLFSLNAMDTIYYSSGVI